MNLIRRWPNGLRCILLFDSEAKDWGTEEGIGLGRASHAGSGAEAGEAGAEIVGVSRAGPEVDSKFGLTFLYLHLLSFPPAKQAFSLIVFQPSGPSIQNMS